MHVGALYKKLLYLLGRVSTLNIGEKTGREIYLGDCRGTDGLAWVWGWGEGG